MNLNKALKQIKHLDRFDTLHAMSSGSSGQLTSCQGASKDYFWSSNLNWVEVFAAWHHWAGLGPVLVLVPPVRVFILLMKSCHLQLNLSQLTITRPAAASKPPIGRELGCRAVIGPAAALPPAAATSGPGDERRGQMPQWQPGHRPRGSHFYTHTRNTMTR